MGQIWLFSVGQFGAYSCPPNDLRIAPWFNAYAKKSSCAKGLKSNIARCLDDYGIPLYVNTAITKLRGKDKLGVYIAPLDGKKTCCRSREFVECDTLLSSQLVPDSDLAVKLKLKMDRITLGPVVDETKQTSVEGIFATGSFLHIHDLADDVSFEAQTAGKYAALYAQGQYRADDKKIRVIAGGGIIYAVPQIINGGDKKAVVLEQSKGIETKGLMCFAAKT